MLRYPSLRAPLDILFLVCCIALTADVLVPEIWGNGKTKDYPLWFWAGQQVLQGRDLYPSDPNAYFEFIYPPLPAVLLAIPAYFGKIPLYLMPVAAQRRRVVDDGAVLERDDGLGADARPVAVRAAGLRHRYLRVRHVRSRAAEPRPAGDDAVRVLAAAARSGRGWREACSRWPPRSRFSRWRCFPIWSGAGSGRRPRAWSSSRRFSVRGAGAGARLPAQCLRIEDLVSGHGRIEFGAGVRTARRAELVVGQSIHHRGDASADAAGQLQPGQSGQAAGAT